MTATRTGTCALLAALALAATAVAAAAPLETHDVLLNHFGGKIQQFRGGILIDTIAGTSSSWAGVAVTRQRHVATVRRTPDIGLERFDPGVGPIGGGPIADILLPVDVDAFSDGTFVIADLNSDALRLVDGAGAGAGSIANGTMDGPAALAVAPDDTVWVANRNSQDVDRFDRAGNDLGGFALGFDPGDIAIDPDDGTLWISNRLTGTIVHRSPTGADLGSIDTGIAASPTVPLDTIGINRAGVLLALDVVGSAVLGFDREGNPVGSFPVPQPSTPFRLVVVPEPLAAAGGGAAAAALLALAARRRRRA